VTTIRTRPCSCHLRRRTLFNGRTSIPDYERVPYLAYGTDRTNSPGSTFNDDRLHPKALVTGDTRDGQATAYPLAEVKRGGVANDRVGDQPVIVAAAPGDELDAFDRRVDSKPLSFQRGIPVTSAPAARGSSFRPVRRWSVR
jgi:hypothetical protein